MKHALIGSLSVLAMIAGTAAANAQANINPNIYPTYRGAPVAQQPSEWYATPGPVRRGNMCAVDVDAGRGYGYMNFGGGLARRTYLWMVCSCSDGLLPLLGK